MIEQILVYKVVVKIKLKHLYFVCHIGRKNLLLYILKIGIRDNPKALKSKWEQLLGGSLCGAQIP